MMRVLRQGRYKLLETKAQTKILRLDDEIYAWVNARDIGEILVASHSPHKTDTILSLGRYRLYEVDDEPELSDQQHLELAVGENTWQSYLLPTGLPKGDKKRSRVIPTNETITRTKGGEEILYVRRQSFAQKEHGCIAHWMLPEV